MSQPVATTCVRHIAKVHDKEGDMDEGAGGTKDGRWRWAVDSPCRSGQMRRGWHSGIRTVWAGWFFVWYFGDLVLGVLDMSFELRLASSDPLVLYLP